MQKNPRKERDIIESLADIENFQPIDTTIQIWEHPNIWVIDNEESCSKWLLKELKRLQESIKDFVKNGFSIRYTRGYNYTFLRNLAFNISQSENFKTSLIKALKWKGKLGFECAVAELKHFRFIHKRLPNPADFLSIVKEADKGSWKMLGIHNWNDLLYFIFGGNSISIQEKNTIQLREQND